MQLDSLAIELRPRSHWEALDLGCLLVRRWWAPLYASWLITALPVALLLLALPFETPAVAMLLFWWLKPVYERAPLLLLSRAIFGEAPRVRAVLPQLGRALRTGMLMRLTVRRLAPSRSFDTPVTVLEGSSGEQRRKRLAVLQRTAGGPAFWLTIIGVHVEGFLQFALLSVIFLLIPQGFDVDLWTMLIGGDTGVYDWTLKLTYFLAVAAVGPVYVASGFCLYLNRRIELEGWDIELRFRQLARRVSGAAVLLLVALTVSPAPAEAEVPEDPQASRVLIDEVLDGEHFHREQVSSVPWFLESWFDEDQEEDSEQPVDLDWLESVGETIALLAEVLLWVGAAVLVIFLARWIGGQRIAWRGTTPQQAAATLAGFDLGGTELEDAPFATARTWWASNRQREALALMYRAALVGLRDRHGVPIERGDTERECLMKANGVAPQAVIELLGALTRVWLAAGYAHRLPTQGDFEGLAASCEALLAAQSDQGQVVA